MKGPGVNSPKQRHVIETNEENNEKKFVGHIEWSIK